MTATAEPPLRAAVRRCIAQRSTPTAWLRCLRKGTVVRLEDGHLVVQQGNGEVRRELSPSERPVIYEPIATSLRHIEVNQAGLVISKGSFLVLESPHLHLVRLAGPGTARRFARTLGLRGFPRGTPKNPRHLGLPLGFEAETGGVQWWKGGAEFDVVGAGWLVAEAPLARRPLRRHPKFPGLMQACGLPGTPPDAPLIDPHSPVWRRVEQIAPRAARYPQAELLNRISAAVALFGNCWVPEALLTARLVPIGPTEPLVDLEPWTASAAPDVSDIGSWEDFGSDEAWGDDDQPDEIEVEPPRPRKDRGRVRIVRR